MPSGELTAQIARQLSTELEPRGFEVLFDHGQHGIDCAERLGEIVSWFGDSYDRGSRLAVLDIAVIFRNSDKVAALIEVEETTQNPKVLIGDVMATLLGEHMKFQGKRDLEVGEWTTLIVLVKDKAQKPRAVTEFLEKKLKELKFCLSTANAHIGRLVVLTFTDTSDLKAKLKAQIEEAIRSGGFSTTT